MNRLSFAVASLIGAVYTVKINTEFATGSYGDEDLTHEIRELKKRQADDNEFLQLNAGIRAKWIELPECQQFVNYDSGDTTWNTTAFGEVIPLDPFLTNAIIATCKGPYVPHNRPLPYVPSGYGIPTPVAKSVIYDPVWKTSLTLPYGEHQVSGLQNGKIDKTTETTGPVGDFWPKWKYVEEKDGFASKQPFQDALSGGGQNT